MKKYENQLPQAGRGNVHVAYQGKAIDQMIYDFMEEQGIPGMTLAIVQAPYIPRVAGYGVTDLEKGNLAAAKTLWPIGPISQGYAAVAVMQLYEKGKLDLNDPIGKYLKDIPENWKPISILQLMQHSSGIADYRNEKGFDVSADYRPEQLIETVAAIPLAFEPGTDVKQSATNFLLLTSIIEKTGKMPYHDFVKKYQIDYLGLKQTFFGEDLAKVKQEDVTLTGHAIECRINAEDPTANFRPCPGKVEFLHFPGGPGVRVDSALYNGCTLSPYYDSLAAKVMVHAPTRLEAIRRMRRCLEEFTLEGFPTNAELSYELLFHPTFVRGGCTTAFLDRSLPELLEFSRRVDDHKG